MSISSDAAASTLVNVLPSVSAANTAAATSGWIDVGTKVKGDLIFIVNSGAITGSFVGKIRRADDGSGTNPVDVTGATHSAISTANQTASIVIPATVGRYLQYVGTVTTGPAVVGVTLQAHPGSV